ncbi:hypothetical protein RB195_012592 [Necator americanus]|uniref:Uncharacterized protein n=1 Tax=Necator americanus TaxID=51031 RepID=A0ABR1DRN7_NECAM
MKPYLRRIRSVGVELSSSSRKRTGKKKKAGSIYHRAFLKRKQSTYSSDTTNTTTGYKKNELQFPADPESLEKIEIPKLVRRKIRSEFAEGNLLLCNFVVVIFAIDFLLVYTFFLSTRSEGFQEVQHETFSMESSRKAVQVMSDSLDCSLLIKEAALDNFPVQHQMLIGVTCLALVVPYTVNPSSSLTMLMYYKQNREGLARSYQDGDFRITKKCEPKSKSGCSIRNHLKLIRSYVESEKTFNHSYLNNAWMAPDIDLKRVSKWLGRRYHDKVNQKNMNRSLLLRRFQKPKMYDSVMQSRPNDKEKKLLYSETEPHVVLSEPRLEYLVNNFLRQRNDGTFINGSYNYCNLSLFPVTRQQHLELWFPCGSISSILSACIIRLVREIAMTTKFDRGYMDSGFYGLFLRSSKIVEYKYAEANKRQANAAALLSKESFSSAVRSYFNNTDRDLENPGREINDRVVSTVIWRSNIRETILILNLGLSLDSKKLRPNATTSAASVVVADKSHNDEPIIVATASGSIRTVEAVASVILRMLLFNEDPGEAIHSNASFYDFQKRTFFCENKDYQFLSELASHGINCSTSILSYFEQHDRKAMAASRHRNGRILAAVDQRPEEFNYAVGF